MASVFAMKPDAVRVSSPFVGGAFVVGLLPQCEGVLAVLAA
jgi:xanthine dehydrogenase YagR molybdenum-binding subunit